MLRMDKYRTESKGHRRAVGVMLFLALVFLAGPSAGSAGGFASLSHSAGMSDVQDSEALGGSFGVVFAQHVMEFESDSDGEVDHAATFSGARVDSIQNRRSSWPVGGFQRSAADTAIDPSRAPPHA